MYSILSLLFLLQTDRASNEDGPDISVKTIEKC